MNFFNIFGKTKVMDILAPERVNQNMKEALETLEKRETYLEESIKKIKEEARCHVTLNRTKAINLLKKAKLLEKQLVSINGQKYNLEVHIAALEQGIMNRHTIACLRQGKQVIDDMITQNNSSDLGEFVDDIIETIDRADEISDLLSQPIGLVNDDDELLEEKDCVKDSVKDSYHSLHAPVIVVEKVSNTEKLINV